MDIRERVDKVNSILLDKGYSVKEIMKFWFDCKKEAKKKVKKLS